MIYKTLLSLLIFLCVFDPADSLFGLKVPIFILTIFAGFSIRKTKGYSSDLVKYFLLFSVLLPVLSYLFGLLLNSDHYWPETTLISVLKPYLFLFIAFSLVRTEQNIAFAINALVRCLLGLSLVTIALFLLNVLNIVPFELLYVFGNEHTIFTIGERSYGAFTINRVYFHTSPMLVFSLCYYLHLFIKEKKRLYLIFVLITAFSFFISGTRNNMLMAILPFAFILYINSSKNLRRLYIICSVIIVGYIVVNGVLSDFTSKDEASNETKLSLVPDYLQCYSNPRTFLIGDGIGSFFVTKVRGQTDNNELTYFELLRRFGIFGFIIYLYLMIKPVKHLIKSENYSWLGLSYALYLVMIFSNPFFFSSNGMIILSLVLSVYFTKQYQRNSILA